ASSGSPLNESRSPAPNRATILSASAARVLTIGPELSTAPGTRTLHVPDIRAPTRWPGDAVAVVILVALPIVVFGLPALLGHAVLPGDDLTQNFPLRVLAGRQIQHGQLPLY